jgi:hypothetical protein
MPDQSYTQGLPITSLTFNSSGGQTPYTYSSTTLPSGLSLSSGGVLSGTPTAIATTSVTVTVTDSLSATANTTFSVAVVAVPAPLLITRETITLQQVYGVISEMSFLDGIVIPAEVGGSYKVTGEMYFVGLQPDTVVGGSYKVIGEMSFLTIEGRYKVIGEMSWDAPPPPSGLTAKTITYFACEEFSGFRESSHTDSFLLAAGSGSFFTYSTSGAVNDGFPPQGFTIQGASDEATFSLNSVSVITYAFAFKFTTVPSSSPQNLFSTDQFRIVYNAGYIELVVVDDVATEYTLTYSLDISSLDISNVTDWHLVVATIDTSGSMSLQMNNMSIESASCPTIGSFAPWAAGLIGNYIDMIADEIGVFNADLDTSDRNTLWNSGNFNTYTTW